MIEVGADVTINGVVVKVENASYKSTPTYKVKLKSGDYIKVEECDINTYRPKQVVSDVDMRKGN